MSPDLIIGEVANLMVFMSHLAKLLLGFAVLQIMLDPFPGLTCQEFCGMVYDNI